MGGGGGSAGGGHDKDTMSQRTIGVLYSICCTCLSVFSICCAYLSALGVELLGATIAFGHKFDRIRTIMLNWVLTAFKCMLDWILIFIKYTAAAIDRADAALHRATVAALHHVSPIFSLSFPSLREGS